MNLRPSSAWPRSIWRRGLTLLDLGDPAGAAADVRRAMRFYDELLPQRVRVQDGLLSHS